MASPAFLGAITMTSLKLKTLLASLALAASGMAAAQNSLLNVSYDVAREFYKDYNAAFVAHYKKTTGQDVKIDQSHAGSSAQARAVNDGLAADVVTMNTTTDVQFLADSGVVAKDWAKKFPHDASPTTSTMRFLVRNGNPKNSRTGTTSSSPVCR
jgi:sulfate transport system substrate-binding protein